ncbi:MAG: hypothetical protein IPM18_15270 [Phycisphaerales bacterium]|nr:hypothetical protein [Phycisphaerales bacterium]
MRSDHPRGVGIAVLLSTVALLGSGCIWYGVDDVRPGDTDPPPPPPPVNLILVNSTAFPLDPEVFSAAATIGPGGLFNAANKLTEFGVGLRGVLLANTTAEIAVDCGSVLIGTVGGAYGNDLNDPDGTGQPYILQQGVNFACGDTIVLTFTTRTDGSLVTTLTVVPAEPAAAE